MIKPKSLSESFRAVDAKEVDFDDLYALYSSNKGYSDYFSLALSKERLVEDMTMLPGGCSKEQKHFLAYYDGERLIAIIDIISGYPDEKTCYIGLFMVSGDMNGQGIGTRIISELCKALEKEGFEALRLAYGKRYQSAKGFWTKNMFKPIKEAVHDEYGELIVAERKLR